MSKPPRDLTSFGSDVYFVTASTWGHRSLFQTDRMAALFIDTLFHYYAERKFLLFEFVVMPDHFHLLLTPTGIGLEKAMQFIKGGFSYRAKKELGAIMEIWERGYVDHRVRDNDDYARHAMYIQQNPVETQIVMGAEEYFYSSANARFNLDACPQGLKPQIVKSA